MTISHIIRAMESSTLEGAIAAACAVGAIGSFGVEVALGLGSQVYPFALSSIALSGGAIALAVGGAFLFLHHRLDMQTGRMGVDQRDRAANILRHLPFHERDSYLDVANQIQAPANERLGILEVLRDLPQEERPYFIAQVNQLNLRSSTCIRILAQIPPAERGSFVQQIQTLRLPETDRLHALTILRDLPFAQRANFISLASRLPYQTPTLLRSLIHTPQPFQEAYIADLNRWILPNMTPAEKQRVSEIFFQIPENQRTQFFEQVSEIVRQSDTHSERFTIIDALSMCHDRNAAMNRLRSLETILSIQRLPAQSRASLLELASQHTEESLQNLLNRFERITSWWMTSETKCALLCQLSSIDEDRQEAAVQLIHFWMGADARMALLSSCSNIHVAPRLIQQANRLIRFWMDGIERAQVIERITQLHNLNSNVHADMIYPLVDTIIAHASFWRPVASLDTAITQRLQAPAPVLPIAPMPGPAAPLHFVANPRLPSAGGELPAGLDEEWEPVEDPLPNPRAPAPVERIHFGANPRVPHHHAERIHFGANPRLPGAGGELPPAAPQPLPRNAPPGFLFVNNEELNRDPRRILQELYDAITLDRSFPTIQYHQRGEAMGQDIGGLTRTFVSHIFRVLGERPNLLQLQNEDGSLLPSMQQANGMTSDAQTKCYNAIGMIFAYALRNHRNILIGNHFHPLLYQMLHSLTPQEVTLLAQQQDGAQLPPTIYKKWLKAYLKSQYADYFVAPLNPGATEQQQRDYLAALNAAVDTFVDNEQAPLPQPMIDQEIQSRQEFFENAPQIGWALDAFKILAGSMARHLPNIQDNWNHWKGAAPQDLQNKIEGVLTKEKVLNAFWPGQNYPAQNTRDGFLKRWIDEANPEQLKKFVWAISGSYSMPDGVRFWIQNPQRDGNLPVFHTCGRAIDLSQYATYEAFNQALMIALNNLSEDGAFGVA